MSAIGGYVPRPGGAPAREADALRLVEAVRFLGPDRQAACAGPHAALAHGAFHTTPESLREAQPLVAGPLALVADARIDNRDELIEELAGEIASLGLAADGLPPTDADLVLAAYRRWGVECPVHLLGDFAFALWDAELEHLFAARDVFGVRPFYYADAPGAFVFGSEARAVVAFEGVPRRPNEALVPELLETYLPRDLSETIFEGVRTLPAAHRLTVHRGAVRIERYYTLRPAPGVEGWTDAAYEARFRELFTEAVRCRVRSAFPLGSQLSGGLDSSAVTCVAREVVPAETPLHTFTLTFEETPDADERPYVEAVLAQGGFVPHDVSADRLGPLGNLAEIYARMDDGLVIGTQHHVWALLVAARDAGVRVMLDGIDGDTVVDHGRNRLFELARAADWGTFAREVRLLCERFADTDHRSGYENDFQSPGWVFQIYGRPELDRLAERGPVWRYVASLRAAARAMGADPRAELRRVWRRLLVPAWLRTRLRGTPPPPSPPNPLVRPEWRPRPGSAAPPDPPPTVRPDHLRFLAGPKLPYQLSIATRVAAVGGVELAHPFFDRRLVEFCLALPPEQSLGDGWTRRILRRALAGMLPRAIAERPGKASMGDSYDRGLLVLDAPRLAELAARPGWGERFVDMALFRAWVARGHGLGDRERLHLGSTAAFLLWVAHLWPDGPEAPPTGFAPDGTIE